MSIIRVGDKNCKLCPLHETRNKVVRNVVNSEAEIAVLGLGPGKNEDIEGDPFIGAAGNVLKKGLVKAGIDPSVISYLNSVLCKPPGNKLKKAYTSKCVKYLEESLSYMPNLKIVMVLGVDAYKFVSGKTKASMGSIYSLPFKSEKYKNILFYPNYHPAALLYNPDPEIVTKFFKGFTTMLEILDASKTLTKKHNYKHILKNDDLDVALEVLKKQKVFAFDTETTSKQPHKAQLLSLQFSWEEKTGLAIPFMFVNDEKNLVHFWDEPTRKKLIDTLREIFSDPNVKVTAQNGKYDSLIMRYNFGFRIKNLAFDTMLASFLLDSNKTFSLEDITVREIPEEAGIKTQFWSGVPEDDFKDDKWYENIPLEELLDYGTHDSDVTFRITKILARRINE